MSAVRPAPPEAPELYIGYLRRASPAVARRMTLVALGLVALAIAVACVAVTAQGPFPPAVFEYGTVREFRGWAASEPVPSLWVRRPGRSSAERAFSTYYLVAPGKHGAERLLGALDRRPVRLRGSLAYRAGETMIEVVPDSVEALAGGAVGPASPPLALGSVTLVGEIVDSKCFLGVMNPGSGKTHSACAARCLSGGIPPLLVVTAGAGSPGTVLLTAARGESLGAEIADLVAEPVAVSGELIHHGELRYLRTERRSIRRLDRRQRR